MLPKFLRGVGLIDKTLININKPWNTKSHLRTFKGRKKFIPWKILWLLISTICSFIWLLIVLLILMNWGLKNWWGSKDPKSMVGKYTLFFHLLFPTYLGCDLCIKRMNTFVTHLLWNILHFNL
jgi:hypothetical protein